MKNTFASIAVLTLVGSASAQSSVTIFGVLDVSISRYNTKSSFHNDSGSVFSKPNVSLSKSALSSSGNLPSRIGFRGTEDLGGGLAAGFWLESTLTNDDGAVGIGKFDRRATVSLSGGFGEIRLGRDYVPTFWPDAVFDPFYVSGVGASLLFNTYLNLGTIRGPSSALTGYAFGNYARTSNSIAYWLPPIFGGIYGHVMYGFHENVESSAVIGSPSKVGAYAGGRLGYLVGPLDVSVAYGESTAADTQPDLGANKPGLKNKLKTFNFGASYDFGPIKLFGELSQIKDQRTSTQILPSFVSLQTTDKDKYNGALVGVTVPVGAGVIKASYARVKFKNGLDSTAAGPFTLNRDASSSKIALGYVHNLSKRTALYATVARTRIKNGQNNPDIMAVGAVGGAPFFTGNGYGPRSSSGYDLGIRHTF